MQQRTINFLKMTSGVIAGMQNEKSVWESEVEIVGVFTDVNTIKQQVKTYNASLNNHTTNSSNRTVSGTEISSRISLLREKLDILDNLVEGLIDDEAFIAQYKSWRRIIDYGKGKTLSNKEENVNASVTTTK